jgi:predicted CopG family antitoxin
MVKVITIMDDVYAELYRLKRAKGMSFSEVIRYLISESEKEGKNVMVLAGSLSDEDIDKKTIDNIRKAMGSWKKYV